MRLSIAPAFLLRWEGRGQGPVRYVVLGDMF
jgi:hypothetical protein